MNYLKKIFNWQNIRLALIFSIIVFIYGFSMQRNEQKKITEIKVELAQENENLLSQMMVNKLLIENFNPSKKVQKKAINLNTLEKHLNKHPMIEESNVYLNVKGELIAKVFEKMPLARVLVENETRYIDKNGDLIPLSKNYSARVPIVLGSLKRIRKPMFLELLQKIENDQFFKESITTLEINNKNQVYLYQRGHDYLIVFGQPTNINIKLNNLKVFYQYNSKNQNLNNYKIINLAFTKQVIGTKIEKDEQ